MFHAYLSHRWRTNEKKCDPLRVWFCGARCCERSHIRPTAQRRRGSACATTDSDVLSRNMEGLAERGRYPRAFGKSRSTVEGLRKRSERHRRRKYPTYLDRTLYS